MHFGDRLCGVLGDEAAMSFVRFVLRTAAEGLREHASTSLIQDRVRTELQAHFSSEGKRLLQLASEHASMIFEIASLVRDGIQRSAGAARLETASATASWRGGRASLSTRPIKSSSPAASARSVARSTRRCSA